MTTTTPGAKIFYTKGVSSCTAPQHNASGDPLPGTSLYTQPVEVQAGLRRYFKAVGYKAGMTDSNFTACVVADNIQQ